MTYVQPEQNKSSFNCPHCSAYAMQRWGQAHIPQRGAIPGLTVAYCDHCNNFSVWFVNQLIYPAVKNAPPPHPDMPDDIKKDFEEARSVFSESPRSSAALLRLTIQKLCKHLGLPGTNINDDIKAMVANGLPLQVQQSLDIVRVVGNEQVHPGTLDVRDDPETATRLFELVNYIVEDRISRPKQTMPSCLKKNARASRRETRNQRLYEVLPECWPIGSLSGSRTQDRTLLHHDPPTFGRRLFRHCFLLQFHEQQNEDRPHPNSHRELNQLRVSQRSSSGNRKRQQEHS